MKKKFCDLSLIEVATICHKQDCCSSCPLYSYSFQKCKISGFTPVVSAVKFGEEEINYDLSIVQTPARETISQAVREEFFEDR